MIALVTVLGALPLGYFLKSPTAAYLGYVALYAWAFSYQGAYLMNMRADGDYSAFQPETFPVAYGIVSLAIMGVGFLLVAGGVRLRVHRESRSAGRAPALA